MGLFGSHTYSISYLRLFCNLPFLQAANIGLFFLQKMDDNAILGIIFFLNFSHYLRQSLPQSSALSSQCSEQAPEKPFELRLRDSECFVYRKMSRSALAVLYVFKQVRVLCLRGTESPKSILGNTCELGWTGREISLELHYWLPVRKCNSMEKFSVARLEAHLGHYDNWKPQLQQ